MGNLGILEDACLSLPHATRSMFGGHGLFAPNGGMFAAVVDGDRVALKLPREADYAGFRAEGAEPWVYDGRMSMSGWLVIPEALYDEPRRLAEWARRAHATAAPSKTKLARAKKAAGKAAAKKEAGAKGAAAKGATGKGAKAPARKAPARKVAAKGAGPKGPAKGGSGKGAAKRRGPA